LPDPPPVPPERGEFAQLLRAEKYVGPGVVEVAGPHGEEPNAAAGFRLRADFERHAAVALVADRLVRDYPKTFGQLAAAIASRARLVAIVADDEAAEPVRAALRRAGVAKDRVRWIQAPTDTIWIRDFGPVFVEATDGSRRAFDFDYRRRSGPKRRDRDDAAGASIARQLDITAVPSAMLLEGGNLLSNGRGLLLASTTAVNANVARGYEPKTLTRYLGAVFGARTMVVLEPLRRESTGHVDVFACFTDARTVVVGRCSRELDPENAALLDRNAALLAGVRTAEGPLRVVRVPMPPSDDDRWRTYTNGVLLGGTLLVPTYRDADRQLEAAALETFRRLLPNGKVVGIDASELIAHDGALRCVTLPVPGGAVAGGSGVPAFSRAR
jgi:agmatine deiminase